MRIAFVLPTRNRHAELGQTLERLGGLELACGAEVIVVDNASDEPARAAAELANGVRCRVIRMDENLGAAARNVGVRASDERSEWVVMLDDDSSPLDGAFAGVLAGQGADVAAVMADIRLGDGSRERGGLPEVFIGCGVAIRREVFAACGGYDASFGYYAEEYDLAARIIAGGGRVVFAPGFGVLHRKVSGQRDLGVILARLVRNNGWVMRRYAPQADLTERLAANESRYRAIAETEGVSGAFEIGLDELRRTIGTQARTPLTREHWERFTGERAAREAIWAQVEAMDSAGRGLRVAVVDRGKNDWAIDRVMGELAAAGRVRVTEELHAADAVVIGTLSPGPMLDAAERWWSMGVSVMVPFVGATRRVMTAWG